MTALRGFASEEVSFSAREFAEILVELKDKGNSSYTLYRRLLTTLGIDAEIERQLAACGPGFGPAHSAKMQTLVEEGVREALGDEFEVELTSEQIRTISRWRSGRHLKQLVRDSVKAQIANNTTVLAQARTVDAAESGALLAELGIGEGEGS